MYYRYSSAVFTATTLFLAGLGTISPALAQTGCDLSAARSSVQQVGDFYLSNGKMCAEYQNKSTSCSFPVAIESFSIYSRDINQSSQTYLGSQVATLLPGQKQTLCTVVSSCATQVDSYVAESSSRLPYFDKVQITNDNAGYGGRFLQGILTGCFCNPNGPNAGCTYTQGYYKNHPEVICDKAVSAGLKIGTVSYSKTDLLTILGSPVKGNCFISLAHQLITAKLNLECRNASAGQVGPYITAADNLLGSYNLLTGPTVSCSSNPDISMLIETLTKFNEGNLGPAHCSDDTSSK